MPEPTFHLPPDLAQELIVDGLAQPVSTPRVDVAGSAMLSLGDAAATALVVLSTGADVVAVTGIRPPLQYIAEKLLRWRSKQLDRHFALLAIGPRGQLRLDVDTKPDTEAVIRLLETLWEED